MDLCRRIQNPLCISWETYNWIISQIIFNNKSIYTDFHNVYTSLYSQQHCVRVPLFLYPYQNYLIIIQIEIQSRFSFIFPDCLSGKQLKSTYGLLCSFYSTVFNDTKVTKETTKENMLMSIWVLRIYSQLQSSNITNSLETKSIIEGMNCISELQGGRVSIG